MQRHSPKEQKACKEQSSPWEQHLCSSQAMAGPLHRATCTVEGGVAQVGAVVGFTHPAVGSLEGECTARVAAALFMHRAGDFEADPTTSRGRGRTGLSARLGWNVAIAPSVEGALSRGASSIRHVVIANGRAAPSPAQAVQSHEEWTDRNVYNVSLSRAAPPAERTG